MNTLDILRQLIGFDTTSRNSNRQLIDWVAGLLREAGLTPVLVENAGGSKASLFVTAGPDVPGGVLLSGHTDVVPVDGQNWTKPPFSLTSEDGCHYGRGTADMKGFIACALAAVLQAARNTLNSPLHLALSYDEEVGCLGVRPLLDMLARTPFQPRLCIVGEPTGMAVATGHKGKTAIRATCTGLEGHAALAPLYVNALHLGADLMALVRSQQAALAGGGNNDADYDVPYTTLHVARFLGGTVPNIVPNRCEVDFEIRNLAADDPLALLANIRQVAAELVAKARMISPVADIAFEITNAYPGLDTPPNAEAVAFVKSLTGGNSTIKVAFGTEGGLFAEKLGIQTVICGPGSMSQGHRPDEFVSGQQLALCDAMLARLLARLA